MQRPKIIAHRGVTGRYPENTLPAFAAAIEAGADGVEFDVRFTGDGQLVVHHDAALGRVFSGNAALKLSTAHELRRLSGGTPEVRIPLLEEVLDLLEQRGREGFMIHMELKIDDPEFVGRETEIAQAVKQFRYADDVTISSFNHHSLQRWRTAMPQTATGMLYMEHMVDPWLYAAHLGVGGLHPYLPTVSRELVAECHARGFRVCPFTVNRVADVEYMADCGVDALFTDDVASCQSVLS
ncbi:MAG: glycerophosphodiester phosphodiesterase [Bacilli bacterium]